MRVAKEMAVSRLRCFGDSDLVASQVMGTCDATDPNMIAYRRAVDQLGGCFAAFSVEWIDRRKNEDADALSRVGSSKQAPPPGVFLDVIRKPSILPRRRSTSAYHSTQSRPSLQSPNQRTSGLLRSSLTASMGCYLWTRRRHA